MNIIEEFNGFPAKDCIMHDNIQYAILSHKDNIKNNLEDMLNFIYNNYPDKYEDIKVINNIIKFKNGSEIWFRKHEFENYSKIASIIYIYK